MSDLPSPHLLATKHSMILCAEIQLKQITAEQSFPLRHKILRPEQTLDNCRYEGDFEPTTVHIGAFHHNQLIGICSIYTANNRSLPISETCQLRAMATDPSARGKGVGMRLLSAAETYAAQQGHNSLWANARKTALGFYQKSGYDIVGDEFEIAGIGAHALVIKRFVTAKR